MRCSSELRKERDYLFVLNVRASAQKTAVSKRPDHLHADHVERVREGVGSGMEKR